MYNAASPASISLAYEGHLGFGCATIFILISWLTQRARNPHAGTRLRKIFSRVCFNGIGRTVGLLTICSLVRVVGSVWVFRQWGKIAGALMVRRRRKLLGLVKEFLVVTLALAFLSAFRRHNLAHFKEDIRAKLTQWCHARYMTDAVFYKVNKVGDSKIEDFNRRITSDIESFASLFVQVTSQSLMRAVEVLVYSVELSRTQGVAAPLAICAWFAFTSCVSMQAAMAKLSAKKWALEDEFHRAHVHVVANCERIALLGGCQLEKIVLDSKFQELFDHSVQCIDSPFSLQVVWGHLKKYFVCLTGLAFICRSPPLSLQSINMHPIDATSEYIVSTWRHMEAASTSIEDFFGLGSHVHALSSRTTRVDALMDAILLQRPTPSCEALNVPNVQHPPTFRRGEELRFEHVSVGKPDGTLLVKDLNLLVKRSERVLVTGQSGCGKSALVRTIRQMWPLVEGTITTPVETDEMYIVPQVSYMPFGTFRDLIIYPHTTEDMLAAGHTDDNIYEALRRAHVCPTVGQDGLEFIFENHAVRPNLGERYDWQKVLSPCQKQKLGFARMFYHKPAFAVLDDCTTNISFEIECDLYEQCTALDIAVLSISGKKELKELHHQELHIIDASGKWELLPCKKILNSKELFLSEN